MPKPVFNLAVTGADPKATSREALNTEANRVIDRLWPLAPSGAEAVLDEVNLARDEAAASAIQAAAYDGVKVDTFAELLALTSGMVAVGETVRIVEIGAVVKRLPDVATGDLAHTASTLKWQVLPSQGGAADIRAFGCVMDGVANDTLAFQAAFDSGLPLIAGKGEIRLTDSIRLPYGASFQGAGGAANYAASPLKIKFDPATKRDLFIWKTAPVDYVFAGVTLSGFSMQGAAIGGDVLINLPFLYGGKIDCFAYTGFDVFIKARQWLDCDAKGGAQGFRTYGVHFFGDNVNPSDVTTSSTFDLYLSQGPIAYYAPVRGVTAAKIRGVVESVDLDGHWGIGNNVDIQLDMTEAAPRTDAGSAWKIGTTGSGWAGETSVHIHIKPGIGYTGGVPVNAVFAEIGEARCVSISGYINNYAALISTTDKTMKVLLHGDTAGITRLGLPGGIYDPSVITFAAFDPQLMTLDGTGANLDTPMLSRSYGFWPDDLTAAALNRLMVSKAAGNKLVHVDAEGNVSAPIGSLKTAVLTGWSFNGGRTSPGEIITHSAVGAGLPAQWMAQRYGADTALTLALCSTTSGSAVISYTGGVAPFFGFKVGDWVTVSAGYASATVQRRIVAVAADLTSITLDSTATSTVADTVTIQRLTHSLIVIAQQGSRITGADPIAGSLLPDFVGQRLLRTDTNKFYTAYGAAAGQWTL